MKQKSFKKHKIEQNWVEFNDDDRFQKCFLSAKLE
jgi:hypothetical protein